MRITLKAVNTELAKRRHNAVPVNGNGYFYFEGAEVTDWLDRTVRVPTLSSLPLAPWIKAFDDLRRKNAEIRRSAKPAAKPGKTAAR